MSDERVAAARRSFELAASGYDAPELDFFRRISETVVDRLDVAREARVLDVPCGTGHATRHVLRRLGPDGRVSGLDLSGKMLAVAATKVGSDARVELREADMRSMPFEDGAFDEVLSVFGIFFLPDMVPGMVELWRLVAPGGRLTVVTWKPNFFGSVRDVFMQRIHELRPDLVPVAVKDHRRLAATPDDLRRLGRAASINSEPVFSEVLCAQTIPEPSSWWRTELGAARRGIIESLTPQERDDVRVAGEDHLRDQGITSLPCDALVTTFRR